VKCKKPSPLSSVPAKQQCDVLATAFQADPIQEDVIQ